MKHVIYREHNYVMEFITVSLCYVVHPAPGITAHVCGMVEACGVCQYSTQYIETVSGSLSRLAGLKAKTATRDLANRWYHRAVPCAYILLYSYTIYSAIR